MKKVLSTVVLVVMLLSVVTVVDATNANDDLMSFLSGSFTVLGEEVKLTSADLVKVERFLEDNPVTAEEVTAIKAKVNETVKYVNDTKAKSIADLTVAQKQQVIAMGNEAAQIVGATISVDSKNNVVEVYKDGKLVDTFSTSSALAQTGGQNVVYFAAVSVLAIIAVASIVYVKRIK